MQQKIITIVSLVGIGILGRLLPHIPNSTPITAVTLAAGRRVGKMWAVVVPLASMILSDLIIGFYEWQVLVSVYISFALIGLISGLLKPRGIAAVGLAAIGASLLFFVVTNGAVWAFSPWYEKSLSGLLYCYTLGLPFLGSMLAGDLLYTAALFGGLRLTFKVARRMRDFIFFLLPPTGGLHSQSGHTRRWGDR